MSRRGLTVFALLLTVILPIGWMGCTPVSDDKQTAAFYDVFDTASTVTVYGADKDTFAAGEKRLHDLLLDYQRLCDIYHTYPGMNNLCTVNAAAGQAVAVDERLLDVLEYGIEAGQKTDGRVNILLGAVLSLWHDCRQAAEDDPESAYLPDEVALAAAGEHISPDCLIIDRAAGTVRLTDPLARIDVGAVAKGYATERAAEFAENELGWSRAVLNIGGNVRVIGAKDGKDEPYRIGLQNPDPDSAETYFMTVSVTDTAVVTSGDYQRYYIVDGVRYAHIVDPDTLYPAAFVRAVTVVCPDSGLADVLSTALFTLPTEEGQKLLDRFPDASAVWTLPDGKTVTSPGFPG